MTRLNGKTAVITGGATGIGRAAAKRFIDEGAVVPLVHLADISGRSTSLQGVQLTSWDVDVWNIGEWTRS